MWNTPIYMKKNRPAYLLSTLCMENDIEKMEDLIFCTYDDNRCTPLPGFQNYFGEKEGGSRDPILVMPRSKICTRNENVLLSGI